MPLTVGIQLGSLEITALLGKGGMGEVYRARDTKLKRDVAIKILPDEFSRDPARVNRFQREAEVLASLNHPNIGAIYDLQEANETRFLVLELVEGETLAERIVRRPIPVGEALDIAKNICEALEAAHERDIIHRDLKPANVKITPEGKVKVLDFGLAKAMEAGPAATLSNSPTLSVATNAGVILGTAAYMSPEQARGENTDTRTDIFSFGCVLYEMLTGRQSFQGRTVSDVLASVLAREPDLTILPVKLNPRIRQLIRRAVDKEAKQRWQAVGDIRVELETTIAEGVERELELEEAKPFWKRAMPAVIASFVFSLITGLAVWNMRPSTPAPAITRFSVPLPEGQQFTNTGRLSVALSPDGTEMIYVANGQLYLRSMAELESKAIPVTDRPQFAIDSPSFSPDGRSVGFWAGDPNVAIGAGAQNGGVINEAFGGVIKRIAITGGASVTLCSAGNPYGLSWEKDGTILYGQPNGIMRISSNGGGRSEERR